MKRLLIIGILAAFVVPTALAVPPGGGQGNAAQKCKAERDSMGLQAFGDKYGTSSSKKNAFGACVSAQIEQATEQAEKNAAKACKAERVKLGVEGFRDKYGTNKNKKNAFGKCVAKLVKSASS